jgi:hypothetical protein
MIAEQKGTNSEAPILGPAVLLILFSVFLRAEGGSDASLDRKA